MTSTKPNYLRKFPPPDTITQLGGGGQLELQHMNWGTGAHKRSVCKNDLLKCVLKEISGKYKVIYKL